MRKATQSWLVGRHDAWGIAGRDRGSHDLEGAGAVDGHARYPPCLPHRLARDRSMRSAVPASGYASSSASFVRSMTSLALLAALASARSTAANRSSMSNGFGTSWMSCAVR